MKKNAALTKLTTLMLLVGVLLLGFAYAGALAPSANEEVCGTYSFIYNTTLSDTVNVSLWRTEVNGSTNLWTFLAVTQNTSANQTSFTISYNTAGVDDGDGYVWNFSASDEATFESATVASALVDNTGPVISWSTALQTRDKDTVYDEDFYISITSNEQMLSRPTVAFKGKSFTLLNTSLFAWYYDFADGDLPDDSYVYSITGGNDNCSASNTGSNTLSQSVNIYSKSSVAVKKKIQEQAVADEKSDRLVKLLIIGTIVYFVIKGNNGKKKKK